MRGWIERGLPWGGAYHDGNLRDHLAAVAGETVDNSVKRTHWHERADATVSMSSQPQQSISPSYSHADSACGCGFCHGDEPAFSATNTKAGSLRWQSAATNDGAHPEPMKPDDRSKSQAALRGARPAWLRHRREHKSADDAAPAAPRFTAPERQFRQPRHRQRRRHRRQPRIAWQHAGIYRCNISRLPNPSPTSCAKS